MSEVADRNTGKGEPRVNSGPETVAEIPPEARAKNIKEITMADLRVVVPKEDETVFVLQCNARDVRDPEQDNYGGLTAEAIRETRENAKNYFLALFRQMDPEERSTLDIMVISSDASLIAPEGMGGEYDSPHKRGAETAALVIEGIKEAMREMGVSEEQLLNASEYREYAEESGVIEFAELEPLRILTHSPEFVEFLRKRHTGDGGFRKFWAEYEKDTDAEKREEMRAEGVVDIAERMRSFIELIARGANERHKERRGRRLIIWGTGHYDNIIPFVKSRILGTDPREDFIPIKKGSGLTMEINHEGLVTTELSGQAFNVDLFSDGRV